MGNEVQVRESHTTEMQATHQQAAWSTELRERVRENLAPKASDAEMFLFEEVCRRTGLDAWARQVYLIGRYDKRAGREVHRAQVSIDGFRLVAQRSGEYGGQVGPQWCGTDGNWRDVWLSGEPPSAARVGVVRAGFSAPLYAIALWTEYVQTNRDGAPSGQWSSMPTLMLAKCAESLALRKAFPAELSGLYTGEELDQADNRATETARQDGPAEQDVSALPAETASADAGDGVPGFNPRKFHTEIKTEFGADVVKAAYAARGIERLSEINALVADEITTSLRAAQASRDDGTTS